MKICTLKYYRSDDARLRRIITYRDMFDIEYRIKVFPIKHTAQDLIDNLNNKEGKKDE